MKNLLLVAAVLFAGTACQKNDKTATDVDRHADRVIDNAEELRGESAEVTEVANDRLADLAEEARDDREDIRDRAHANMKALSDEAKDVGEEAHELTNAQADFERARMVRIATLRGVQSVLASQAPLINAFANDIETREKLQIFQMRLDEAGNEIQALQGVPAASWDQRHDDVNQAMSRLEDARDDAWKAVDDADHPDRTSMR